MKKLVFIMPLMAISLLVSCNNSGGGGDEDKVQFALSSEQSTTVDDNSATVFVDWKPTDHKIVFESFVFASEQSEVEKITFDKESEARPMPVTITFKDEITKDINGTLSFNYEDTTAKAKGESSIEVTIDMPEPTKKWYEYDNWWNYCSNGNPVSEATPAEVGTIVNVTVYGISHRVRLIGVNHVNVEGGTPEAHCTFEFADIISNSDGVISTYWNDKAPEPYEDPNNYDFPHSTLNDLLNEGENCIFKALPTGLQKAIKKVDKPVATTSSYDVTYYPTKLFPLSHDELCGKAVGAHAAHEGTIYQYYDETGVDFGEKLPNYWLRSPNTDGAGFAWKYINDEVTHLGGDDGFITDSLEIAPAFCI